MPKIIHNGQEYDDVNQMPPDVREAYEQAIKAMGNIFADNDQNGMPDVLENTTGGSNIQTTYQVEVNGQVYKSPEELPANLRPIFDHLSKQTDGNISDWIKDMDEPASVEHAAPPEWIEQLSAGQFDSEPVIQPVEGNSAQFIILLALGVILVIAFIVAALILFK
jgi:hypothetical protein